MKNPFKKDSGEDKAMKDVGITKEYWSGLKDTIDTIFEKTKDVRKKMDDNMKQFRGEIWDETKISNSTSKAITNFLFSTVQAIAPMLTDTKPNSMVVARHPEYTALAKMYTDGLSYFWDTAEMQEKVNEAIIYAMVKKKGIFELYYDPNKQFGGDIGVNVVDPSTFFISPGFRDEWLAPMMGVRENKPVSWIRDNFPEITEIKPSGAVIENSGDEKEEKRRTIKFGDTQDYEMESYFARVYRVWVRDTQTMYENSYQGDNGEELKKLDKKYPYGKWVYFTDSQFLGIKPCMDNHGLPPFVCLDNYVDPGNFLGFDENVNIEGLNKEFNLQFQYLVDFARRNHTNNWEVDAERVDPDDVKQNINSCDHIFISEKFEEKGTAIRRVEKGQVDASVKEIITLIPQFIQEVTGVTEISKGEAAKKERQSASEIGILIESSHTRTRQRIRNLEHTIKRLSYLVVRMMMQYYSEPRTIRTKKDDQMIYSNISNTVATMKDIMMPEPDVMAKYKESQNPSRDMPPGQKDAVEDYERVIKALEKDGDADPVYFEFDIEVQSESTLPMDKQTRANQAMKLFAAKAIDRESLLDVLQWPNADDIIKRIKELEEQQKQKAQRPQAGIGG